ncbi:MAG: hypothetical protein QNJ58_21905 [Desulfobacterales bacterium]|nr:hypothetical protein [Desulfobacterales bacterium]
MKFLESSRRAFGPYLCDAFMGADLSNGAPTTTMSALAISREKGVMNAPR